MPALAMIAIAAILFQRRRRLSSGDMAGDRKGCMGEEYACRSGGLSMKCGWCRICRAREVVGQRSAGVVGHERQNGYQQGSSECCVPMDHCAQVEIDVGFGPMGLRGAKIPRHPGGQRDGDDQLPPHASSVGQSCCVDEETRCCHGKWEETDVRDPIVSPAKSPPTALMVMEARYRVDRMQAMDSLNIRQHR